MSNAISFISGMLGGFNQVKQVQMQQQAQAERDRQRVEAQTQLWEKKISYQEQQKVKAKTEAAMGYQMAKQDFNRDVTGTAGAMSGAITGNPLAALQTVRPQRTVQDLQKAGADPLAYYKDYDYFRTRGMQEQKQLRSEQREDKRIEIAEKRLGIATQKTAGSNVFTISGIADKLRATKRKSEGYSKEADKIRTDLLKSVIKTKGSLGDTSANNRRRAILGNLDTLKGLNEKLSTLEDSRGNIIKGKESEYDMLTSEMEAIASSTRQQEEQLWNILSKRKDFRGSKKYIRYAGFMKALNTSNLKQESLTKMLGEMTMGNK